MKNDKILCEKCGKSFSPGSYLYHPCMVNASTMLSRKMSKLLSKKRRYRGLMVDLSMHHGEVPQPSTESTNLKSMLTQLNSMRMAKFSKIIATVRNVLHARRMKHKNPFWRQHYS